MYIPFELTLKNIEKGMDFNPYLVCLITLLLVASVALVVQYPLVLLAPVM